MSTPDTNLEHIDVGGPETTDMSDEIDVTNLPPVCPEVTPRRTPAGWFAVRMKNLHDLKRTLMDQYGFVVDDFYTDAEWQVLETKDIPAIRVTDIDRDCDVNSGVMFRYRLSGEPQFRLDSGHWRTFPEIPERHHNALWKKLEPSIIALTVKIATLLITAQIEEEEELNAFIYGTHAESR